MTLPLKIEKQEVGSPVCTCCVKPVVLVAVLEPVQSLSNPFQAVDHMEISAESRLL